MHKYQVFDPSSALGNLDEMEFSSLATFNSAHLGVFWSEAGGPGPWEMHPNEDELLHVIEGAVEIQILPNDESAETDTVNLKDGQYLVVPKGLWHRHKILSRTKEMYLSPKDTLHSQRDDPRRF